MYLRGLLLMREREEEGKRKEGKEERMEGKGGAEGERPCAPPVANSWLRHWFTYVTGYVRFSVCLFVFWG